MANHDSAIKRIRQTARRTEKNRRNSSRVKTQVRRFKRALEAKDASAAKQLLTPTVSMVDKAVQKGVLTKNTASRLKSRLTRRANALAAAK
jgi:small subunit ribosomal protein S20